MKPSQNFVIGIVLLVTILSFANTLSYDFTNSDEEMYITLNPHIRDLSTSGIVAIFSSLYLNLYTPLTILSFAVDYALWGLNPAGYHAVNLLLHLLNTWLVFLFCRNWSRSILVAGIVACLFGVHPIHVESVAWIAERKDLLFTMFAMSALLLYDHDRRHPGKRMVQAASIFMFLCSLLAKPQAVALPVVLFLMDYFRDSQFGFKRSMIRIWPFAALSAFFCILTLYLSVLSCNETVYDYAYSWWNRPFLAMYGICFYIVKIILPFNLTAIYEYPLEIKGMLPYVYYFSAVGIAGLIFATRQLWKRRKDLAFGIFFYLLMLLPVIQIVQFAYVIVAERYAYISSLGIFLIIGQVVAVKIKEQRAFRYWGGMVVVFVILGLALLTYERNKVWANSITLFTDVIKKSPRVAIAYNNRGVARFRQGDFTGANQDYNEAIRLDPKNVKAFFNRGILRAKNQEITGALSDYSVALAFDPSYSAAYYNRGLLFDAQGDTNRALRDFSNAILSDSEFGWAFTARGTIRAERGQYDKALADFKCAIQFNPMNAIAYFNMGKIYLALSNSASARLCFENAHILGLRSDSLPNGK